VSFAQRQFGVELLQQLPTSCSSAYVLLHAFAYLSGKAADWFAELSEEFFGFVCG
jgi:hypothetical protein